MQLSPSFKDVDRSIARADSLMSKSVHSRFPTSSFGRSEVADRLTVTLGLHQGPSISSCFPRCASQVCTPSSPACGSLHPSSTDTLHPAGYNFTSRDDILSFCEDANTGKTFLWASHTARRLGSFVIAGFPQLVATESPSRPILHNSVMIVSPAGQLVSTYAKHHLFETDKTWATAGPAFVALDLEFPESSPHYPARDSSVPVPTFRIAPCICMDLNPDNFTAPWNSFELARFAKREKVDLVVCPMSWLVAEGELDDSTKERWEEVQGVMSYWAARMGPLLETGVGFVGANRVGSEGGELSCGSGVVATALTTVSCLSLLCLPPDITFTGASCIMDLDEDGVDVLAFGAKRGQELVRATIQLR